MNGVFNYQILRDVRKELGNTQADMAKMLDMARTTYADYENGRIQPPANKIQAMCEKLDLKYSDFMVPTNDFGIAASSLKTKTRMSDADKALLLSRLSKKKGILEDIESMQHIAHESDLKPIEKDMLLTTLQYLLLQYSLTDSEAEMMKRIERMQDRIAEHERIAGFYFHDDEQPTD